ncbi:zinc-binding dehydrogenase [Nostocoides sp. F2B08]|uniref:NAD(P)-dependent alcohol dehydrogenase n=1 Tax=Nostocoides sp. F2B08 TaxID=2653936 RepID=UPI0012631844|nr:NAD(P)-dependent alcohol dehydrogenase [Tetrasphaera sp. F2B08]KAB7745641.1 zinc-binding dehydrogenase [Tetrasphaera sp. F2B08]
MRAITQTRYGGTDRLRYEEHTDPTPGPGEVLIQVRAAGVDRGTWHLMTGRPYAARVVGGLIRPKSPVLGRDVAGVVIAVGDAVTRFAVGDEVMGTASGSFAELAVAPETRLALKPSSVSFPEAAVIPVSGGTALQALRDTGGLRSGQLVLVIGASGGVGSYAVQIAAAMGAEVTAVASRHKADLVRSLGAVDVIDYASDEVDSRGPRFDLVLDLAGNRPISVLRRAMTRTGTLVVAGGDTGGRWTGGAHRQLLALARSPFVTQRLTGLMSTERGEDYATLAELVDSGRIRPALERTYPLHEAPKAIDHLAAGHVRGKVALTV